MADAPPDTPATKPASGQLDTLVDAPPRVRTDSAATQRWLGAKNLLADGVEQGSRVVERSQRSLTRRVFSVLGTLTGRDDLVRPLEQALWFGFAASHSNVRLVSRLTSIALDALAELADPALPGHTETPIALRSDIIGTQPWLWDGFVAVVNGVVGDHLAATQNPLAVTMALRLGDTYATPSEVAAALASQPAPLKLAVYVHGLTATEWSWALDAQQQHGAPDATYASLLQRDAGFVPVLVRYNSGLHISDNGQQLHAQLQALVTAMPGRDMELALIGHSMGGLVAHSAVHYAGQAPQPTWLASLRHVITLGTPHEGAPLERFGRLVEEVLGAIDTPGTRIPADVMGARSAGIKDLRHGYLVAEDWRDADAGIKRPRTVNRRVAGVQYHRVVGTITADPDHPVGRWVGDTMVRPSSAAASAAASQERPDEVTRIGGVSHVGLSNDARVFSYLRAWLGAAGEGTCTPSAP